MIMLDYSDKRPIYEQVVSKFKDLIYKGILQKDEQMPSVRSLAIELAINPNTYRGHILSLSGMALYMQ